MDEAVEAPLPTALFSFPFVKEVFLDDNYVSITKYDRVEWNDITQELREFLRGYLEQGKEVVTEYPNSGATDTTSAEAENKDTSAQPGVDVSSLDTVSQQIITIIDEYVKPAVASDGGNIQFENYDPETQKVSVILQGACSGCPSSTFTLKNGIENMLKEMLPGKIGSVEAING